MKLSLFVIFFLLFSGCRYSRVTIPNNLDLNEQMSLPAEEKVKLSFNLLNQSVFIPKCVSCHGTSGGVNLESYPEIIKNLRDIKSSVFMVQTMPKKDLLSDDQKRLLWNWIEIGAPLNAQKPGSEPPPPEPIQATYESINKNIFIPKCVTCHSAGNSAWQVLLSRQELLDSPLELALPGNPDESGLVIAVERTDKKRMPPEKDGYSALKDDEKAAIRAWIEAGAQ
ncbi:hypothetical protein CIK05_10930 [Bdellovibrio sp. qaytius]|nr:hypothetical protein CIK05_10930 [Bdellovibrio sp. qaytius]